MTRQEFWNLIAETRRDDPYEHGEALTRRLTAMPEKEILSFGRHFEELVGAAYSWKLWGAAHLINGGCSDDGFEYFRHWLLLQGQTVYEAALRDPDGLAALEVEEDTAEADINPAAAHEAKTGRDDYYELLQQ